MSAGLRTGAVANSAGGARGGGGTIAGAVKQQKV